MSGFCTECRRRGTYKPAEHDDLCGPCHWRAEAAELPPDYFDRWWIGKNQENGRRYRMPAVLRHDFKLKPCVVCGEPVLPWKISSPHRPGEKVWCTPSAYNATGKRAYVTCSKACHSIRQSRLSSRAMEKARARGDMKPRTGQAKVGIHKLFGG